LALSKLTDGNVHLIYKEGTECKAFSEAKNVVKHTAFGPHPIANPSLHIQKIDPIQSTEDIIWTVSALDVIAIGHFLNTGKVYIERIISIAGPSILPKMTGYYRLRAGFPISHLISGRLAEGDHRLVSGDPLMGKKVESTDFIHFYDTQFCAIPDPEKREFLHFFRLGAKKYSFSRAYFTGHEKNPGLFRFTTSLHGEPRPFIDGSLYDKVMPLNVPTMSLVKAVMAEDYDYAEELGLLEVVPEDFALPTFVCPSKMEMTEIIKQGLAAHAQEVGV
jgi:Na+-transporting NADH:ubiquinone oxidoreductase subunit A